MRRWLFLAKQSAAAADVKIDLIQSVHVEGRVVDARNGKPVPEVSVGVYGPMRQRRGAAIVSAKTETDGRDRFRLPRSQTDCYICGPFRAEFGRRPRVGGRLKFSPACGIFRPGPRVRARLAEARACRACDTTLKTRVQGMLHRAA